MSLAGSILPLLPSTLRAVSSIGAGVQQSRALAAGADRLRDIAVTEGRLRRIQAARLIGKVQASFGGRGVVGGDLAGTSSQLESEAALFEHTDVKRAEFRFLALADQVDARSEAALNVGVVGGIASGFDLARTVQEERRLDNLEKAIGVAKAATAVPTVLGSRPIV